MLISTLIIKLAQNWKVLVLSAFLGLALGLFINSLDSSNQEKVLYSKTQTVFLTTNEDLEKLENTIMKSRFHTSTFKILFPNSNSNTLKSIIMMINYDLIQNNAPRSKFIPENIKAIAVDDSQIIELQLFYNDNDDSYAKANIYIQELINQLVEILQFESQPLILDSYESEINSLSAADIENLKTQLSSAKDELIQAKILETLQLNPIKTVDTERIFPFQFIKIDEISDSESNITVTYDDPVIVEDTTNLIHDSLKSLYPYFDPKVTSIDSRIIQKNISDLETISIKPTVNRTLVNLALGVLLGLSLPILFYLILIYRDRSIFHPEQINLLFGRNADIALPGFKLQNLKYPITSDLDSDAFTNASELVSFISIKFPDFQSINIQATTNSLSSYITALFLAEANVNDDNSVLIIDGTFSNKFNLLSSNSRTVNWLENNNFIISQIDSMNLYTMHSANTKTNLKIDQSLIDLILRKVDILIYVSSPVSDSHNFLQNQFNLDINILNIDVDETDRLLLSQMIKRYDFAASIILLSGVPISNIGKWIFYEAKV